MRELSFFKGYQQDEKRRAAFNQLAVKTFDLSFEDWYKSGYWREKYIPYTLFEGDKAVANVSVNLMYFNVNGQRKRCIQLGTVMTDTDYRGKGLSRKLMQKVLADWQNNCDFIYLFANSTVLEFYPKLGFSAVKQYQFSRSIEPNLDVKMFKLDMDRQENRDRVYQIAKEPHIYGKLSMQENADLVMFYCISILKDNVYFLPSLDAIVIVSFEEQTLFLHDVLSKEEHDLDQILTAITNENANKLVLGFVPKSTAQYQAKLVDEKLNDEVLFIQNGKTELFEVDKIMFPSLSHA